ncbi:MAG: hypothetical protein ABIJ27_08560 [Candidatus Omnitrophota bacterium]
MATVVFFSESFPLYRQVEFFGDVVSALKERAHQAFSVITDPRTKMDARGRGVAHDYLDLDRMKKAPERQITTEAVKKAFEYSSAMRRRYEEGATDARAQDIAFTVRNYLTDRAADVIVFWNMKTPLQKIARAVADTLGVKTLMLENGAEPGTVQVGAGGVNYENAWLTELTESEFWDQAAEEMRGPKQDMFTDERREPRGASRWAPRVYYGLMTKSRRFAARHPEAYLENTLWQAVRHHSLRSGPVRAIRAMRERAVPLPKDYFFVPFQVHDDSNVVLHSPNIRGMEEFLSIVHRAVRRSAGPAPIVVKEHPEDCGRVDYTRLKRDYPDVIFFSQRPAGELIAGARAVITINSTVGYEALQSFKPVITIGEAFYDMPGVTFHVDSSAELNALLLSGALCVNRSWVTKYIHEIGKRLILCDAALRDDRGVRNLVKYFEIYVQRNIRARP